MCMRGNSIGEAAASLCDFVTTAGTQLNQEAPARGCLRKPNARCRRSRHPKSRRAAEAATFFFSPSGRVPLANRGTPKRYMGCPTEGGFKT